MYNDIISMVLTETSIKTTENQYNMYEFFSFYTYDTTDELYPLF